MVKMYRQGDILFIEVEELTGIQKKIQYYSRR